MNNTFTPLDGAKALAVVKPTVRNCRAIYSVMARTTTLPQSERVRFARMSGMSPTEVELVEDEVALTSILDTAVRLPAMEPEEQEAAIAQIAKLSEQKKAFPRYLLDDDFDDDTYIPALCAVLFEEWPKDADVLSIDLGEVHRALGFFEKKRSGLV